MIVRAPCVLGTPAAQWASGALWGIVGSSGRLAAHSHQQLCLEAGQACLWWPECHSSWWARCCQTPPRLGSREVGSVVVGGVVEPGPGGDPVKFCSSPSATWRGRPLLAIGHPRALREPVAWARGQGARWVPRASVDLCCVVPGKTGLAEQLTAGKVPCL